MGLRAMTAVLVALSVCGPAAAQEVNGTWKVTWAQGIRVERDGSVEVERWGEATLDLRQQGDSVTGSWTRTIPGEGVARWRVEGTLRDGLLRLAGRDGSGDSEATRSQVAQIESLGWEGRLEGDRLAGEMWLVVTDVPRPGARRPWHAVR